MAIVDPVVFLDQNNSPVTHGRAPNDPTGGRLPTGVTGDLEAPANPRDHLAVATMRIDVEAMHQRIGDLIE